MAEETPESVTEREFAKAEAALEEEMDALSKVGTPKRTSSPAKSVADSPSKPRTSLKRPGGKVSPKKKAKAKAKTGTLKRPASKKAEESGDGQPAPSEGKGSKKAGKSKAREADEEKARKLLRVSDDASEAEVPEVEEQGPADGQVEKAKRDPQKSWYFHKHLSKLPEQATCFEMSKCPMCP